MSLRRSGLIHQSIAVAILAQGTSRAVADTQAFSYHGSILFARDREASECFGLVELLRRGQRSSYAPFALRYLLEGKDPAMHPFLYP